MRFALLLCAAFAVPASLAAQTCALEFTIEVTRGVGDIPPGTELMGHAEFTTEGSFRQEGGSTAHLATGTMALNDTISGPVWALITTSRDFTSDLVGIYAHHVTGFTFAGSRFDGPMALTLYGTPGTRPEPVPPMTQDEWDSLALRRTFQLHSNNGDMLAGDVTALQADCT
ncbi:hypothetical protein E2K80_13075 [Rhodophyticola sp. CCM32]|uniref:hypothetical protein n=1 Tax=Rhodophyticola sp. CCM32 TaxID=2916397 RepID=UPI00107F7AB2|nr:hypothetical protein [Rhodophyticola sp. CCM32]QBY01540.1 hypothetical protein E2K80_13075 [Rhodophyticola sp. CCM32]